MSGKNIKPTDEQMFVIKTIVDRRKSKTTGVVEYKVSWQDGSSSWEPRIPLIAQAWPAVGQYEKSLPKDEQMLEFPVTRIVSDRPMAPEHAVDENGSKTVTPLRDYLVEWGDNSRSWEPRRNLENGGMVNEALVRYLRLPIPFGNDGKTPLKGLLPISGGIQHITSPLELRSVRMIVERKEDAGAYGSLLSPITTMRPNVSILDPHVLDYKTTDKLPTSDVSVFLLHGETPRPSGKICTSAGPQHPDTLLNRMTSPFNVLMQCYSGPDLIEPIRFWSAEHQDKAIVLVDAKHMLFTPAQVIGILLHALAAWAGNERLWSNAFGEISKGCTDVWFWCINAGVVNTGSKVGPRCPLCDIRLLWQGPHTRVCSKCSLSFVPYCHQ